MNIIFAYLFNYLKNLNPEIFINIQRNYSQGNNCRIIYNTKKYINFLISSHIINSSILIK
jgi:hypothetical protein